MLLHNQSKSHLRWKISMNTFTCEPWGSVEIPDMFVMHCKARGLPLDVSPVAPEVRAKTGLDEATAKAAADESLSLRHELELAKSAEAAAKGELERVKGELSEETTRSTKLQVAAAEQRRLAESNAADRAAAEKLLEETAKKLAESQKHAERLEATVVELKKPAKK